MMLKVKFIILWKKYRYLNIKINYVKCLDEYDNGIFYW